MDEHGAIELCLRHRDPVGFEFLVKQYRREAFFHALGLLGNSEDAADACQEAFAKAFAAIPRLKELKAFYPWFYTILRNCCLNVRRRRKTVAAFELAAQQASGHIEECVHPADLLDQREAQAQVWRALQTLPVETKEILVMKYIQGNSYQQITQQLGVPPGTVMSRLYYARKAFRDAFLRLHPTAEIAPPEA